MRTIAVIPARFRSNRLPGKPLAEIAGRTMVELVCRQAERAREIDSVLVATDDPRIFEAVESFGGEAVMTSPDHPSGSDRVAEAVMDRDVDIVVNVQGDEPMIAPAALDRAILAARADRGAITTLAKVIRSREELFDPNVVKVVADSRGRALYFSRSPVPAPPAETSADGMPEGRYLKHIGLYVYPKDVLARLMKLAPSPLELQERLEQLRALENGIPVRVVETDYESISVDTASDLERVRQLLKILAAEGVTSGTPKP